jgi:surface antigen
MKDKIVTIAKSYIGKTEKANNSGFNDAIFEQRMKETGWVKGASWCSYFAELVWSEAYKGTELESEVKSTFNGSATATYKNFDLAKWTVSKVPQIGALAVWRHGSGWQGHIGIVVDVAELSFKTVEGNTNDKGGREGYIVALKNRSIKTFYQANGLNLIGFVYPKE